MNGPLVTSDPVVLKSYNNHKRRLKTDLSPGVINLLGEETMPDFMNEE